MKLDPVSLRLFVAVMEENTIAAAAAREHLAASAVSRRLADLEGALQVELFTRSNRGTEPTAAAAMVLSSITATNRRRETGSSFMGC